MRIAEVIRGSGAALYGFIAQGHRLPAHCSPLRFTDHYFCLQFLTRLDAPSSRWQHLANRLNDGILSLPAASPIGIIAQLILAKRLLVVELIDRAVVLEQRQADALGSIPAFVEPSFLLLRRVIKHWALHNTGEVEQALKELQLQTADLNALSSQFKVPIPPGDALAGLRERLLAGTLLVVSLPRAGKVVVDAAPAERAPARYTTAAPASLSRPPPRVEPSAPKDHSAQIRALKNAASAGAPLCELCSKKPAAKPITQPPIALAPGLAKQIAVLKQAAQQGAPLCETCVAQAAEKAKPSSKLAAGAVPA